MKPSATGTTLVVWPPQSTTIALERPIENVRRGQGHSKGGGRAGRGAGGGRAHGRICCENGLARKVECRHVVLLEEELHVTLPRNAMAKAGVRNQDWVLVSGALEHIDKRVRIERLDCIPVVHCGQRRQINNVSTIPATEHAQTLLAQGSITVVWSRRTLSAWSPALNRLTPPSPLSVQQTRCAHQKRASHSARMALVPRAHRLGHQLRHVLPGVAKLGRRCPNLGDDRADLVCDLGISAANGERVPPSHRRSTSFAQHCSNPKSGCLVRVFSPALAAQLLSAASARRLSRVERISSVFVAGASPGCALPGQPACRVRLSLLDRTQAAGAH